MFFFFLAINPVAARKTLLSQYGSLARLRIDSMLDALFTKGIVTFEEKQDIEHFQQRDRKGMKWFLDNVIIPSLDQGMSTKYNGFIEVMKKHEDSLLRYVAKGLGK